MLFPVLLDLSSKRVIVIGGGEVAERKIDVLLHAGAAVTVISPDVTRRIRELGHKDLINVSERPYRPGDCRGAFLVIAATDDPAVQQSVWDEAQAAGALINTVDNLELCNVVMPAVLRRGDLTIAVSTAGASPALAVRVRDKIAGIVGPEYGGLLALLSRMRPVIQERVRQFQRRKDVHYRIVDSNVLGLIQRNEEQAAERLIEHIVEEMDHEEITP